MKKGYFLTQEEFLKRSIGKHGDTYGYEKAIYKGSTEKVEIICKRHGAFWQRADKHMSGRICPQCSRHPVNTEFRSTRYSEKELQKKLKSINKDWSFDLSTYENARSFIQIHCDKHNVSFRKRIRDVTRYTTGGCPECSRGKRRRTAEKKAERCVGNILKTDKGYSFIYVGRGNERSYTKGGITKKGYVPHHMYVMALSLGRPIDSSCESIHHKNGIRDDNRLENLELKHRYHGSGQGIDEKVEQSIAFLLSYKDHISAEQRELLYTL
jgi:hypothetical protein